MILRTSEIEEGNKSDAGTSRPSAVDPNEKAAGRGRLHLGGKDVIAIVIVTIILAVTATMTAETMLRLMSVGTAKRNGVDERNPPLEAQRKHRAGGTRITSTPAKGVIARSRGVNELLP